MKRKIRRFFTDPILIVVPIVALLIAGWNRYMYDSLHLDKPVRNLMPTGNFKDFGPDGLPLGWQFVRNGGSNVQIVRMPGYSGKRSVQISFSSYHQGSSSFLSPAVNINDGHSYLFRSYFMSDIPFELLARYYYADGTSQLKLLQDYQATGMSSWSTVGQTLRGSPKTRAVQLEYRFAHNGKIRIDENFVEQKDTNLYMPVADKTNGANLIPHGGAQPCTTDPPEGWSTFQTGSNQATFGYECEANQAYMHLAVGSYKDGEAKWQYTPVDVQADQYLQAGLEYQSDRPADLVAEYELADDTRKFVTIQPLAPASEWTNVTVPFEVPTQAKNLFISVVLHSNGTLNTRNYSLHDITRPGPKTFRRPLISVTFDDGWRSAYLEGAQLLNSMQLRGTFYVNPLTLDTQRFMTTAQINDLLGHGHEVASHSYQHTDLSGVNEQEMNSQLRQSYDYLKDVTGSSKVDFAAPYGATDPVLQSYIRKYYQSARSFEGGTNTRQNFDPYNLKVLHVTQRTTEQELKHSIDEAASQNAWLILVYHHIETSTNGDTVSPDTFAKQLTVIRDSRIAVKTVNDALMEEKSQM